MRYVRSSWAIAVACVATLAGCQTGGARSSACSDGSCSLGAAPRASSVNSTPFVRETIASMPQSYSSGVAASPPISKQCDAHALRASRA